MFMASSLKLVSNQLWGFVGAIIMHKMLDSQAADHFKGALKSNYNLGCD